MGRSQSRDSFAAVRYAVDTGSMPPQPKRSLWARKRVVLPVAAVTLLGAGFLASESRRQPDATATATLDCTSARDVWRPACRPDNLQDWVARAASARDDAPAATGAVDDQAKRASTPKRVVEAAKKAESETAPAPAPQAPAAQLAAPATERATPAAKAPPRVAAAPAAPPEPARKPEAAKPAPEPVRAVEAKPAVPAAKLPEPQPVQQAAKSVESPPARPAPPPVEPVKLPEPQPVQQAAKPVEPQPAAKAAPPDEQAAKPGPQPTVTAEPPRRPAPAPVKVAEEPAPSTQVENKARQKRLAERAARREAARAERRFEPRVIVVRPDAEEPAPPRRLARARPAEPGMRTTAHFPPGFVQALRHYNTRYAYGY